MHLRKWGLFMWMIVWKIWKKDYITNSHDNIFLTGRHCLMWFYIQIKWMFLTNVMEYLMVQQQTQFYKIYIQTGWTTAIFSIFFSNKSRSNINCDLTKKIPRGLAVNNGNIFHVINTTPVNQNKYWQAFKYNHTTGQWSDTPGFIPNGKE